MTSNRSTRSTRHPGRFRYTLLPALATSATLAIGTAEACPVCFGEANTGASHGLTAAIGVLGGTALFVVGAITVVVLRIRARAAAHAFLSANPASLQNPPDDSPR
ncbi:MAG TPA: hypothetical protein VF720_10620 [Candidatus Eisenbacteria bacterium]